MHFMGVQNATEMAIKQVSTYGKCIFSTVFNSLAASAKLCLPKSAKGVPFLRR